MNRWIPLVGWLVLLTPVGLLAQHHGQMGGSGGDRGSTSKPDTDALRDFKRAVALQASPDQAVLFREIARSTQVARKNAQDFLQLAANAPDSSSGKVHDLSETVEEAQRENQKFLLTFSQAQKSLLKDLTKKMGKTDAEITKLNKALEQSGADKRNSVTAEKLEKAIGELQDRQATLKSEMGIKDESPAQ